MVKRICDRCKKEIPLNNSLDEYKPPIYTITKYNKETLYSNIDLCDDCSNELTKWIRNGSEN